MKLNSDSTHKGTYPFYGTVSAVAHSLSVSQLNLDFMYYVTKLLEFSQKVGDDGRKKNMAEIADIMQYLDEREKELKELDVTVNQINEKKLSIDDYIDRKYHNLFWKDGKNFDEAVFMDLKGVMLKYCEDGGKAIAEELDRIHRAKNITVEHRDFHMEYDRNLKAEIIGGRLVEDRVISFDDFRNALPTGGTAESSFLTEQFAVKAGGLEQGGITNSQVAKYGFIIMMILMIGVASYLIINALHIT